MEGFCDAAGFVCGCFEVADLPVCPRLSRLGNSIEWEDRTNALYEGVRLICERLGILFNSPHKLRHLHGVWGLRMGFTGGCPNLGGQGG